MGLAVVAAVAALAVSGVAPSSAAKRPVLQVSDEAPLVLRGAQFKPHEKVVLLATGAKVLKRTLKTDARGTFELELPLAFKFGRCGGYTISVIGASGDRAFTGLLHTTGCTPQLPGHKTPGVTIPGAGS